MDPEAVCPTDCYLYHAGRTLRVAGSYRPGLGLQYGILFRNSVNLNGDDVLAGGTEPFLKLLAGNPASCISFQCLNCSARLLIGSGTTVSQNHVS